MSTVKEVLNKLIRYQMEIIESEFEKYFKEYMVINLQELQDH
jgi:hypothetical protein